MTVPSAKASFLPLMSIQSHRRPIGYSMPVRQYASASDATAQSNAARARLRNIEPRPEVYVSSAVVVRHIAAPEAEAVIADTVPLNMLSPCSWRFLVDLAAIRHQIPAREIMGRSRVRPICAARNEAVYLVVLHTVFSIARIGRMFGKDHTSILAILQKFPKIVRRHHQHSAIAFAPAITSMPYPERAATIERGYESGLSVAVIADQAGLSPESVKVYAHKHNLRHPARPYYMRKPPLSVEAAAQ